MTLSTWERGVSSVRETATGARGFGGKVVKFAKEVRANGPEYAQRAREDASVLREMISGKIAKEWVEIGHRVIGKTADKDRHSHAVNVGETIAAE